MSTTESRCPVSWRYITGLQTRIHAFPGGSTIYAEDLLLLDHLKDSCQYIGRGHSVQVLRGFFLFETVISRLRSVAEMYPGYEWSILELVKAERPPQWSREGLTPFITALKAQTETIILDAAESQLSGTMRVHENFELAKGAVTPTNSGAIKKYLASALELTEELRRSLTKTESTTLGGIGVDANCAFDAAGTPITHRITIATMLVQITEENVLKAWPTKNEFQG